MKTTNAPAWNVRKHWLCVGDGSGTGSNWTIIGFSSKAEAEIERDLAKGLGGPRALCMGIGTEIEIRRCLDAKGRLVENAIHRS